MATGARENKITVRYAKNFILTPANQTTITPPTAIKKDVPRSGCVITNITGNKSANNG